MDHIKRVREFLRRQAAAHRAAADHLGNIALLTFVVLLLVAGHFLSLRWLGIAVGFLAIVLVVRRWVSGPKKNK